MERHNLWVEKYRPRKLKDIIIANKTYVKMMRMIQQKDIPNIIFAGMSGTGKTSTVQCIANELYGKYAKEGALELNASNERGIKSKETIESFRDNLLVYDKPDDYPNFKLVILDEADNITEKAQFKIRDLMGFESKNRLRFVFTCNDSSAIIESIQSLCVIYRFERISKSDIAKRLKFICDVEKIDYEQNALEELAVISQGDLRYSISSLEIVYNSYGKVTIGDIYKICDIPQQTVLKNLLKDCMTCDINNGEQIGKIVAGVNKLKRDGYCGLDIVGGMLTALKNDETYFNELDKIKIYKIVSNIMFAISNGFDTQLQLYKCVSDIILKYEKKKK